MMLTDLLDAVAATGSLRPRNPLARPNSQLPSYKTSIGYLARALQCPDAQHCPQEVFARSQDALRHALDIYLGSLQPPPSSHTIRNTRYNIRTLFKKAYDAHILQSPGHLPSSSLTRAALLKAARTASPYRQRFSHKPYYLHKSNWPIDIRTHWDQYALETRRRIRSVTLATRTRSLQTYLGYFHNIAHQPLTVWDDLFNVDRFDAFVTWHAQRLGVRDSAHSQLVVQNLIFVANHFKHPQAQALKDYQKTLRPPEPLRNKHNHGLSRDELERVALSELQDAHRALVYGPKGKHPGVHRASQHRRSLILRLLLRIPLRQRNIREMQLQRNLYQDAQGHWCLTFKGEELKVGQRQGRVNIFSLDLTAYFPDLIDHLQEYLSVFRPRFPNASASPYVFLSQSGTPLQANNLLEDLTALILKRTGKRCYPHLLRTLWISEFFSQGGTPATAAFILNDTLQTTLTKYYEFMDANHLQEASSFSQRLGT